MTERYLGNKGDLSEERVWKSYDSSEGIIFPGQITNPSELKPGMQFRIMHNGKIGDITYTVLQFEREVTVIEEEKRKKVKVRETVTDIGTPCIAATVEFPDPKRESNMCIVPLSTIGLFPLSGQFSLDRAIRVNPNPPPKPSYPNHIVY